MRIYLTLFGGTEPFNEDKENQVVIPMYIDNTEKMSIEQKKAFGEHMITTIIKSIHEQGTKK